MSDSCDHGALALVILIVAMSVLYCGEPDVADGVRWYWTKDMPEQQGGE